MQGTTSSSQDLFHLIFRALGKDFISICLIHTADKTVKILKNTSGYPDMAAIPSSPYDELCQRMILSQVPAEKQAALLEKLFVPFERADDERLRGALAWSSHGTSCT